VKSLLSWKFQWEVIPSGGNDPHETVREILRVLELQDEEAARVTSG